MKDLKTTYLGIPINNPIVVGSCAITSTLEGIKKLANAGAGAIVLKSIFEEEITGEAEATAAKELGADENNMEFYDYYDYQIKSDVINKYIDLIKAAKAEVSIPIIASINCSTSNEWISYAQKLENAGADGIELNIFKLPFHEEKTSTELEESYYNTISKVVEKVSIPVGVKLAPHFTNLNQVIHKIYERNVQGIVLFNRFTSLDFDIESDQVISGNIYSSKHEFSNSLRWISIMSKEIPCDLVASTGVHDAKTVAKMILAGASSTQVVSAIYKEGVEVIGWMINELETWMQRRGFNSIADFKGRLSQGKAVNPHQFERVQFMRYFSDHVPASKQNDSLL